MLGTTGQRYKGCQDITTLINQINLNLNTMKNLEVLSINVGESIDYKFGLITYDIYKVKNGLYELTDTSSGWVNCRINEQKLTDLLQGKISMLNLNWK